MSSIKRIIASGIADVHGERGKFHLCDYDPLWDAGAK